MGSGRYREIGRIEPSKSKYTLKVAIPGFQRVPFLFCLTFISTCKGRNHKIFMVIYYSDLWLYISLDQFTLVFSTFLRLLE